MSNFLFYLTLRIDSIKCGFTILFWIFLIISVSFVYYLYAEEPSNEEENWVNKKIKNSFLISIFFLILNMFTPSTKELLTIYSINIVKDSKIIGITEKSLNYMDKLLDKKIKELKNSKGE